MNSIQNEPFCNSENNKTPCCANVFGLLCGPILREYNERKKMILNYDKIKAKYERETKEWILVGGRNSFTILQYVLNWFFY